MNKRRIGKEGEDIAVRFLTQKGLRVLGRNYYTPFGEIDIIAEDETELIFVEVKTRKNINFGLPEEAMTKKKMDRIKKSANVYVCKNNVQKPVRFDLLSIIKIGKKWKIEWFKNIDMW